MRGLGFRTQASKRKVVWESIWRIYAGSVKIMEVRGINSFENVVGAASADGTELSLNVLTSFVSTFTSPSVARHVHLADGEAGQLKLIVHKSEGTNELVINVDHPNTTFTSNLAGTCMLLVCDGVSWQTLGEMTGNQEWT